MHLVYFDECGDTGFKEGSTLCFVVTGIIIHESVWNDAFELTREFRKKLRKEHNIPEKIELKGYNIVSGKSNFRRLKNSRKGSIPPWERMVILKKIVDFLCGLNPYIECQNICLRKKEIRHADENLATMRFLRTWEYALQRIEAHIYYREEELKASFSKANDLDAKNDLPDWMKSKFNSEYALIFPDNTNNDLLRKLTRRMHVYNYVPYRGFPGRRPVPIKHILGDPHFQDSIHNHFVQFADIIAYCLTKHYFPYTVPLDYKKLKVSHSYRLENLFPRLDPVLCKRAAPEEKHGVKFLDE